MTDQIATCHAAAPAAADAPLAAPATAAETRQRERQAEYRALMRKFWFAAIVAVPVVLLSYPSVVPFVGDVFPRDSVQLRALWAGMGLAALAVLVYSGNQFFSGAWEALRHRSATMHTLIAIGTAAAWLYSTAALLLPALFPNAAMVDVYYDVTVVVTALVVLYPFSGLLLSPILAALAMSFSSVTVISHANRLKRFRLEGVPI